jgi:hypothetical protein
VCHLRARRDAAGNFAVGWVRRTRVDGDSWSSVEVPLGELRERYLLRVVKGTAIAREVTVSQSDWFYAVADQAADTVLGTPFEIHVAQLSDAFGAGPFARISIND